MIKIYFFKINLAFLLDEATPILWVLLYFKTKSLTPGIKSFNERFLINFKKSFFSLKSLLL